MDWFWFAIISSLFGGTQRFLLKVVVERKFPTKTVTLWFMGTVATLGFVFFVFSSNSKGLSQELIFFGALYGALYGMFSMLRLKTLKYLPTVLFYPVLQLVSLVFVLIFSVIYFQEQFSLVQKTGLCIGVFALLCLFAADVKQKVIQRYQVKGYFLLGVTMLLATVTSIIPKFAAKASLDSFLFTGIGFLVGVWIVAGIPSQLINRKETRANTSHSVIARYGIGIGILFFITFITFLKALAIGPLSLVAVIHSFSIVIVIGLSVRVYKERITAQKVIGIVLSIIAVILLK